MSGILMIGCSACNQTSVPSVNQNPETNAAKPVAVNQEQTNYENNSETSNTKKGRIVKTKEEWKLENLTLGYDLSLDEARKWGLFISTSKGKTSIGVEEPPLFIEPGIFFVRPDNTLYWSSIQTMPFARPSFAEILAGLDIVLAHDYPARGQVIDHRAA